MENKHRYVFLPTEPVPDEDAFITHRYTAESVRIGHTVLLVADAKITPIELRVAKVIPHLRPIDYVPLQFENHSFEENTPYCEESFGAHFTVNRTRRVTGQVEIQFRINPPRNTVIYPERTWHVNTKLNKRVRTFKHKRTDAIYDPRPPGIEASR